jgi:ATP-dependent DNA ligase
MAPSCAYSRAAATTGPNAIRLSQALPPSCGRGSFTLDGEAVVCGTDGVAVFDALHRRRKAGDAILFAFDLIELDGEDFRPMPLGKRKGRLARLLARVAPGIELNDHTEADGAVVFRQACKMGLEGMVPAGQLVAALLSGKQRS